MSVLPGRIPYSNRGPVTVGQPQVSAPLIFSAPTAGLMSNYDYTQPVQGAAAIMRNIYPTVTGGRIRGGGQKIGLAADGTDIVSSFRYKYGTTEKMFMATATAVYDFTSPAAPPTTTAAAISGLTSGDWSSIQHTTTGGSYLRIVNGADTPRIYDGSSWASTPAITFSDSTTPEQLNHVWLFKNFEFYLKNATLDAYYLPVGQIGGAAALFPLGGVMKRGGTLQMGFTWSLEESGVGLNDKCVFVSSEGDVAVYGGTDPSSADTFGLESVFQIGKPLGKNAVLRIGGDVLIATTEGLVPLSQAIQRGGSLTIPISRPIEEEWRNAAAGSSYGWTITRWLEMNLAFITFPETLAISQTTFVINTLTNGWGIITGWQTNCFEVLQGSAFFGSRDGYVWKANTTGNDDGLSFSACYLSQFTAAGSFGQRKSASLASMTFRGGLKPKARLFVRADGDLTIPTAPLATVDAAPPSQWDVGLWDQAVWDSGSTLGNFRLRQDVTGEGDTLALGCVIVSDGDFPLNVEVRDGLLQATTGEASA